MNNSTVLKFNVEIYDPLRESKTENLSFIYRFVNTGSPYGNGYSTSITFENGQRQCYDIRYDKRFKGYFLEFAIVHVLSLWNGEDGSYMIKALNVEGGLT